MATSEPAGSTKVHCARGSRAVAIGSADRDRKSGPTKNKTIDSDVTCKGWKDLRPMEKYGHMGNWEGGGEGAVLD